jgi:nucleoside-diphosphate-sugar epimerase
VGQLLTKRLSSSDNYQPTAVIRSLDHRGDFEGEGINFTVGNLENPISDIAEQIKDHDAVVFTAGSGGDTGADKTLLIDLDGAVKAMHAAQKAKVDRFVMVSAAGADDRTFWKKSGIESYYVAKHYADQMLRETNLNFTILRPVALTDDEGSLRIKASESMKGLNREVPRSDVAAVIEHVLDKGETYGKTIEFSSGDDSIKEAISSALQEQLELA